MKKNVLLTIFCIPFLAFTQESLDSFNILCKTESLIEVVIHKGGVEEESSILSATYIHPTLYGIVRAGEVRLYNPSFELVERFVYKDNQIVLEETYDNGILESKIAYLKDSLNTMILTQYCSNGNLLKQETLNKLEEVNKEWYPDGAIKSVCRYNVLGSSEKCDEYNENGFLIRSCFIKYDQHRLKLIKEIVISFSS